ncbi:MAG: hypothetical protein QME96_16820 [Myxococcota bacterium]|nr:hypothetical protein [Myxococcota bacterium]
MNLTPHPVTLAIEGRDPLEIAPSGAVARCTTGREPLGEMRIEPHGVAIPIVRSTLGGVDGLPDPTEGAAFVVSRVVAEAAARSLARTADLFFPEDPVRDEAGRIVGCRTLARL